MQRMVVHTPHDALQHDLDQNLKYALDHTYRSESGTMDEVDGIRSYIKQLVRGIN